MQRNVIDADDAVGNGATFNGTGGNDLFVGRSAGEEFFGSGGSDVFDGRGGNDSFFLNGGDNSFFQDGGNDRVIAAADDGFQAQVFSFESGAGVGDTIDFSAFNANSIDDLTFEEGLSGSGTVVSAEGSQELNLRGIDIGDINEDDFVFSSSGSISVSDATPGDNENTAQNDAGLNVVDGSDFEFDPVQGAQELVGTDGDDEIIASSNAEDRINALGGDDVIRGFGAGVDIVDSGAGNDTLVADDAGGIVLTSFDAENDTFDFSGVAGADSFDDVEITADADSDEDFLGFTEVKVDNSTRFFVSEETGDALAEDDFVFADDDAAVA